MKISLEEAAKILGITTDEVMFLVQMKNFQAEVQTEPLAWTFDMNEILTYKQKVEGEKDAG